MSRLSRSGAAELARLQAALALAIEDHDVQTISRVLPQAQNLGLDGKEIAAARRILDYVAKQDLNEEVKSICGLAYGHVM